MRVYSTTSKACSSSMTSFFFIERTRIFQFENILGFLGVPILPQGRPCNLMKKFRTHKSRTLSLWRPFETGTKWPRNNGRLCKIRTKNRPYVWLIRRKAWFMYQEHRIVRIQLKISSDVPCPLPKLKICQ